MRPAPPSEVAGPQGAAATVGYVAAGAPLLVVASLAGGDDVDATTVLLPRCREPEAAEEGRGGEGEEAEAGGGGARGAHAGA